MTSQTNVNVPSNPAVSYVPLTLRVEYYLEDPHAGMMFVEPDPLVAPHVSCYEILQIGNNVPQFLLCVFILLFYL